VLARAPQALATDWLYTVRPGDTLWDVSEAYLVETSYWQRLQALNRVVDPQNLAPGSRLKIPVAWMRTKPAPARVTAVEGEVAVQSGDGQGRSPAAPDMLLNPGDEVTTASDSSVSIEFADGSSLRIGAGSRVVFDILSVAGGTAFVDTRLRLLKGSTTMRAQARRARGSRTEIQTPAALSAVRGTDFRVGVLEANDAMRTEVLSGGVAVSARARTVAVAAGFGTVVDVGAPPRPPRPLLPAPELTDVPAVLERVPVRIRVSEVAGATAYRLEIARDSAFSQVVAERVASTPSITGPDLADGSYVLRVRAIDALGQEGHDATRAFVLNARPEPPFPLEPSEGGVVPDGRPQFRWSEPDEAAAYRFQLAAGDDFSAPLVAADRVPEARYAVTDALPPGAYHWRVATLDTKGEEGPFGDPQRFRVPPPGPVPEQPELSDEAMMIRWPAGLPGDRYRFQMARDNAFTDLVVDQETTETSIRLERPDDAVVFIRVQTIDAAGETSAFSAPQRIELPSDSPWLLTVPILGIILALILL
jgi:hypothetical protein